MLFTREDFEYGTVCLPLVAPTYHALPDAIRRAVMHQMGTSLLTYDVEHAITKERFTAKRIIDMNEELKKAATKGRGKVDKANKSLWIDTFTHAIRTDPCGTVVYEEIDGKPRTETRPFSKRNAWAFELMGKDDQWAFSTVLNLGKTDGAMCFTHTLPWCMAKLQKEKDLFTKGTFDKCRARLHNLVSDDFLMIAVLIES